VLGGALGAGGDGGWNRRSQLLIIFFPLRRQIIAPSLLHSRVFAVRPIRDKRPPRRASTSLNPESMRVLPEHRRGERGPHNVDAPWAVIASIDVCAFGAPPRQHNALKHTERLKSQS
jgi:hypothetical protein